MTADETAKSTVYYDSFVGNIVPVWNGSTFTSLVISGDEISMGLDSVTPHVASGSVYDIFGINSSGSLVIAVGPAWSSSTSRGTGAGTTQLALKNGVWTNAVSLTHAYGGSSGTTDYGAVSANFGTYLGSLYATGNGQTGVALKPSATNGGCNNFVALFNGYNRIPLVARSQDSTSGWVYASTTWRTANNNSNNRITFLDGLGVVPVQSCYQCFVFYDAVTDGACIGVNQNATTGAPATSQQSNVAGSGTGCGITAEDTWYPALGLNYYQAMEAGTAASNVEFFGSVTSPTRQLQTLLLRIQA